MTYFIKGTCHSFIRTSNSFLLFFQFTNIFFSDSTVYLYTREPNLKLNHKFSEHECAVTVLLVSPDESVFVSSDKSADIWKLHEKSSVFVSDIQAKQKKYSLDSPLTVSKQSIITRANFLICSKQGFEEKGTLVIYDLNKQEIKHEVVINTTYEVEMLHLHPSHDYVLTDYKSTSVVNGIRNKTAQLLNIQKGTLVSFFFRKQTVHFLSIQS